METEGDVTDDVTELLEGWDGCTYIEALGDSPNVPGIGEVSQVSRFGDHVSNLPVLAMSMLSTGPQIVE